VTYELAAIRFLIHYVIIIGHILNSIISIYKSDQFRYAPHFSSSKISVKRQFYGIKLDLNVNFIFYYGIIKK